MKQNIKKNTCFFFFYINNLMYKTRIERFLYYTYNTNTVT